MSESLSFQHFKVRTSFIQAYATKRSVVISEAFSFFSKTPVSSRKKAKMSSGSNSIGQSTEENILLSKPKLQRTDINRPRSQALLLGSKNDRLPE